MPAVVLDCCPVRLKVFYFFCFFMHYLEEKYYKPITVQDYTANCVSWEPGLTLLDLTNLLSEWNSIHM